MATRLKLWNPIIDDNRMGCCFDVTPSGIQLGAGIPELMKKFLKDLEIETQPEDWYIISENNHKLLTNQGNLLVMPAMCIPDKIHRELHS